MFQTRTTAIVAALLCASSVGYAQNTPLTPQPTFQDLLPFTRISYDFLQGMIRGDVPDAEAAFQRLVATNNLGNQLDALRITYEADFGRGYVAEWSARRALVMKNPVLQASMWDPIRNLAVYEMQRAGFVVEALPEGPFFVRISNVEPGSPAADTLVGQSVIRNAARGVAMVTGIEVIPSHSLGQYSVDGFRVGVYAVEGPHVAVPLTTIFSTRANPSEVVVHEELHASSSYNVQQGLSQLNYGRVFPEIANYYVPGTNYGTAGFNPDEMRAFRYSARVAPETSLMLYQLSAATLEAQIGLFEDLRADRAAVSKLPNASGTYLYNSRASLTMPDVTTEMVITDPDVVRAHLEYSMVETVRYMEAGARLAQANPELVDAYAKVDAKITTRLAPMLNSPVMNDLFGPKQAGLPPIPEHLQASSGVLQIIESQRGQGSYITRLGVFKKVFDSYKTETGTSFLDTVPPDSTLPPEDVSTNRAAMERFDRGVSSELRTEQFTRAEAETLPNTGQLRQYERTMIRAGTTAGGAGVMLIGLSAIDAYKRGHLGDFLLQTAAGLVVFQGAAYVVLLTAPVSAPFIIGAAVVGLTAKGFWDMYNDDASTLAGLLRGTTNVGPLGEQVYEAASGMNRRIVRPMVEIIQRDLDGNILSQSVHGLGVWDKDTGEKLCDAATVGCIYFDRVDPAPAQASDAALSGTYRADDSTDDVRISVPPSGVYHPREFSNTATPEAPSGSRLAAFGDVAQAHILGVPGDANTRVEDFFDPNTMPYATQYRFIGGPDGTFMQRGIGVSTQVYDAFFPAGQPQDLTLLSPRPELEVLELAPLSSYLDTVRFESCATSLFDLTCLTTLSWLPPADAIFEINAITTLQDMIASDILLPGDPTPTFPDWLDPWDSENNNEDLSPVAPVAPIEPTPAPNDIPQLPPDPVGWPWEPGYWDP